MTPTKLTHADWARGAGFDFWRGVVEGRRIGVGATVLFYATDVGGDGPKPHVHPYAEIFVVREGRARFTIGEETIEAEAGDVLVGPAHVPHAFVNLGPGRLETTDVHLSDRWIQVNLDGTTPPGAEFWDYDPGQK